MEREFVYQPPQNAREFEQDDLLAHIAELPQNAQEAARKYASDPQSLTAREQKIFDKARAEWWKRSTGLSYGEQALGAKFSAYEASDEAGEERARQERLVSALASGSGQDIQKLKAEYTKEFGDQLEGVEALFGLAPFLKMSERASRGEIGGDPKERKACYEELTQYQYLLTDFVKANSSDKRFLGKYWSTMEGVARKSGSAESFNKIHHGIITQVATYKVFDSLGLKPSLSHPRLDAFSSVDMLTESGDAIQIKGTQAKQPEFIEVKQRIAGNGVETRAGDQVRNISSHWNYVAQEMGVKMQDYKRMVGQDKDVRAYVLVIPWHMVNATTGEASQELINFVRHNLAKLDKPLNTNELLAKAA